MNLRRLGAQPVIWYLRYLGGSIDENKGGKVGTLNRLFHLLFVLWLGKNRPKTSVTSISPPPNVSLFACGLTSASDPRTECKQSLCCGVCEWKDVWLKKRHRAKLNSWAAAPSGGPVRNYAFRVEQPDARPWSLQALRFNRSLCVPCENIAYTRLWFCKALNL